MMYELNENFYCIEIRRDEFRADVEVFISQQHIR
jgi:hypothetical protein